MRSIADQWQHNMKKAYLYRFIEKQSTDYSNLYWFFLIQNSLTFYQFNVVPVLHHSCTGSFVSQSSAALHLLQPMLYGSSLRERSYMYVYTFARSCWDTMEKNISSVSRVLNLQTISVNTQLGQCAQTLRM
ncbi:unnamed protein product, partial [Ilex paraguariensis]